MLIKCEGKVKPFIICFLHLEFRLCMCFVLNCVSYFTELHCASLMSMKFPVNTQRTNHLYLSAKICKEKKPSVVANPLFSYFALRLDGQDGVPLLCYGGIYCLVLYFLRLNSK